MNNKSLLLTVSMLGTGCIVGGVVAQAFNVNSFGYETEMKAQKANLNSLPNIEQFVQAKLSKQILSNKSEISQVAQQLTQLKNNINQLMLAQGNEQANLSEPDILEEKITPGVTIEEPVEDRQFVDHFASYLANEVTNLENDQESTSKIEQSFDAALESKKITGVSLLSSECKATLCKVELGFDDEATRERYSDMGTSIIPWDGQAFFHQSEAEPNTMIYYVAKEGFELAMPVPSDG